jgi:RNA polymerase sigma factor (sigma-70 family)
MNHPPVTAPSLLVRLRDAGDAPAWTQFVEVYSPLIYRFARRRGLQDADAADLMQDVLANVARGIRTFDYEPTRGLFRSWLFTIVRRKIIDAARSRPKETTAAGLPAEHDAALEPATAEGADAEFWDLEYRLRLLNWGLDQIRAEFEDSTWRAFSLTALDRLPGKEVSERLSISVGAVYIAKSRVLGRLKEIMSRIDETSPPEF